MLAYTSVEKGKLAGLFASSRLTSSQGAIVSWKVVIHYSRVSNNRTASIKHI